MIIKSSHYHNFQSFNRYLYDILCFNNPCYNLTLVVHNILHFNVNVSNAI